MAFDSTSLVRVENLGAFKSGFYSKLPNLTNSFCLDIYFGIMEGLAIFLLRDVATSDICMTFITPTRSFLTFMNFIVHYILNFLNLLS